MGKTMLESTMNKVMDFFLGHPIHAFTVEQISEYIGLNVWSELDTLEADGSIICENKKYRLRRNAITTHLLCKWVEKIGELAMATSDE